MCVWESATAPLTRILERAAGATTARVIVGPEGGLTAAEVDAARARGYEIASLGPRVLRTETAGPVLLAILQERLGDLGR